FPMCSFIKTPCAERRWGRGNEGLTKEGRPSGGRLSSTGLVVEEGSSTSGSIHIEPPPSLSDSGGRDRSAPRRQDGVPARGGVVRDDELERLAVGAQPQHLARGDHAARGQLVVVLDLAHPLQIDRRLHL